MAGGDALLDVESLLEPTRIDPPVGREFMTLPESERLRKLREPQTGMFGHLEGRETVSIEWVELARQARNLLIEKSKDLVLAAWFAEAAGHARGFAGVAAGIRLFLELQRRYWDEIHPALEDGDPGSRFGAYNLLARDAGFPAIVRTTPLAGGPTPLSLADHREIRRTENLLKQKPDLADELAGKRRDGDWQTAVAVTPTPQLLKLAADVRSCRELFAEWSEDTDARFGGDGPNLLAIDRELEECEDLLNSILSTRPDARPQPQSQPETETETDSEPDADADFDAEPAESVPQSRASRATSSRGAAAPAGADESGYEAMVARGADLVADGRWEEALKVHAQALRYAPGGRERFLRGLDLAEICLKLDQPQAALQLLENLEALIEAHKLEEWEDKALLARAQSALHAALKANDDGAEERRRQVFAKLCLLDPDAAVRVARGGI